MRGLTTYVLEPLTFIGALNGGLVGLFGFDLIAWKFGLSTFAAHIVYSIIGVAALPWFVWLFTSKTVNHH